MPVSSYKGRAGGGGGGDGGLITQTKTIDNMQMDTTPTPTPTPTINPNSNPTSTSASYKYELEDYVYEMECRAEETAQVNESEEEDVYNRLAQKERDLILAAELGKALLERNEILVQQNERLAEEYSHKLEVRAQDSILSVCLYVCMCLVGISKNFEVRKEGKLGWILTLYTVCFIFIFVCNE